MKPKLISITCDNDTFYALDEEGNLWERQFQLMKNTNHREAVWVKLLPTRFEVSIT